MKREFGTYEEDAKFKRYIGDSVYADFNGYSIVLTVEDGVNIHARICLEPEVLASLRDYHQWVAFELLKGKLRDDTSGTETS